MKHRELPKHVLERRAVVYVRQSSSIQVQENLESQRRQYELSTLARSYGFHDVAVIDEDLGYSASGSVDRPGFRNLVGQICQGLVGAVFCLEASRLARNGRDWHHLIELCALVGAYIVDSDGAYDPASPNDRLLLGMKGTMSEFELTLLRKRMLEAAMAKAHRGELRLLVPIGYVWSKETGLIKDPDRRIQDAIRSIFALFDRLGSARQVLLFLRKEQIAVPRSSDARTLKQLSWDAPVYRSVLAVLRNPFYAGAYAYGKTRMETTIVDGQVRKRTRRVGSASSWRVLIRDHHEGYIGWEGFERNQQCLARNAFGKPAGSAKSGRGGGALLTSLLRCRRCGRMLYVVYSTQSDPRYVCRTGHLMHGVQPCISFVAKYPEQAVADEVLSALQPVAMEAALVGEQQAMMQGQERLRAMDLERQQAEYDVKLAERRYQAVDPDNRLVAAELEAHWNAALARLRDCEARIAASQHQETPLDREQLLALANDLTVAWNRPHIDPRTKQRLVRALIEEIVVDIDEASHEVILIIHWRGGQHSELRAHKATRNHPHPNRAADDADRIIRDMASRWSDAQIATTLNRLGLTTALGLPWNRKRVASYRRDKVILAPIPNPPLLTMIEAAQQLRVTRHIVRKLIQDGILPATQAASDAPWQINPQDLELPAVVQALNNSSKQPGRPCRNSRDVRTLVIPGT